MKSDAQIPSSSKPSAGAKAAPIAETPVVETPGMAVPVAETPIVEAPLDEAQGAEASVAPSSTPAPMGQAEWAMANHGQSKWRPAKMMHSRGVGLRSMLGCNRGGENQNHRFPSLSVTVRGGSPLPHNSMRMWQSSLSPNTMWQVVR